MKTISKPAENVPRYRELLQILRDQVMTGELKPGDQLPSLVELRASHNVSRGTIEKVHSLLAAEGLIVREQGRGVFVAGGARQKRHGVIAFSGVGMFEQHLSHYWSQLTSGIGTVAAEEGLQLLLINEDADESVMQKIDGLLVNAAAENMSKIIEKVPAGVPTVSVMMPQSELDCVFADDYQGAYEATRHLTDQGHRRIGYMIRSYDNMMERRIQGYSDALQAVGVEPKLAWVKRIQMHLNEKDTLIAFRQHSQHAMEEWLKSDWAKLGCTALLAQNDHAAIGVIAALQNAGLRVPEDVSVVGFDGGQAYEWYKPSLTTIEVPLYEIGKAAAQLLLKKIKSGDGTGHEHISKKTILHLGASSGPCLSP